MALLIIVLLLFLCYSILIIYYWLSWKSIPDYKPMQKTPSTSITVIIPARNEEKNIGRLLTALQQQNYPKNLLEIVVVDDHSTDTTGEIARQFTNVKVLPLPDDDINSYKKKAIETGIAASAGELIITTDADCWCDDNWL